jgi:hypothetical protein
MAELKCLFLNSRIIYNIKKYFLRNLIFLLDFVLYSNKNVTI